MSDKPMAPVTATTVTSPAIIKVAIIEDRREIREALGMLIGGTEGYRLTGSYRSMEEALEKIGMELPDVALVDIGLPGHVRHAGHSHLERDAIPILRCWCSRFTKMIAASLPLCARELVAIC